jgi:hypothetical protein
MHFQQESSSPLQKIPFIQRILFFTCRTVSDPIKRAHVCQSWYETLRNTDAYSTAITIWKTNLQVFPPKTSDRVEFAYLHVPNKVKPDFLDLTKTYDREGPLRWHQAFTAAARFLFNSILLSAMTTAAGDYRAVLLRPQNSSKQQLLRQIFLHNELLEKSSPSPLLNFIRDFHLAGYPKHGPVLQQQMEEVRAGSTKEILGTAVQCGNVKAVETLLFDCDYDPCFSEEEFCKEKSSRFCSRVIPFFMVVDDCITMIDILFLPEKSGEMLSLMNDHEKQQLEDLQELLTQPQLWHKEENFRRLPPPFQMLVLFVKKCHQKEKEMNLKPFSLSRKMCKLFSERCFMSDTTIVPIKREEENEENSEEQQESNVEIKNGKPDHHRMMRKFLTRVTVEKDAARTKAFVPFHQVSPKTLEAKTTLPLGTTPFFHALHSQCESLVLYLLLFAGADDEIIGSDVTHFKPKNGYIRPSQLAEKMEWFEMEMKIQQYQLGWEILEHSVMMKNHDEDEEDDDEFKLPPPPRTTKESIKKL